jgi:hypothetical protein
MQCPLILLTEAICMIGIKCFIAEGLHYSKIWSNIRRATLEWNFNVTGRTAVCEACSATWNLLTNSVFFSRTEENHGKLDRVGRSQDLLDANWLLALCPAFNARTLTLVPIRLLLCSKKFTYLFLLTLLFMCIFWMSTKQLCITSAERIHAYTHIHAYKHAYICICDYPSIGEFTQLLWWWGGIGCYMRFVAQIITGR